MRYALSLALLLGCATGKPSTNVPKFYGCWDMGDGTRLCIDHIYECRPDQDAITHHRWGEWKCTQY